MSKRTLWKGPFVDHNLLDQVRLSNNFSIKTTSRNSVILPFLIGKTINVHNGQFFLPLIINEDMLGHKLGEFIPTRLRHIYKKKIKKNGSKIKSK
jgi:small subunit ribosomal protein S19